MEEFNYHADGSLAGHSVDMNDFAQYASTHFKDTDGNGVWDETSATTRFIPWYGEEWYATEVQRFDEYGRFLEAEQDVFSFQRGDLGHRFDEDGDGKWDYATGDFPDRAFAQEEAVEVASGSDTPSLDGQVNALIQAMASFASPPAAEWSTAPDTQSAFTPVIAVEERQSAGAW